MNGQQYPNAIHMAVTVPDTTGVVERWTLDLATPWRTRRNTVTNRPVRRHLRWRRRSMSAEADEFIRAVMADMMDQQASILLHERRTLSQYRLGNGGPKVGLVSLDGEVLDHELHSVETTYTSDAARRRSGTVVDAHLRIDAPAPGRTGVTKERVKAVAVTGQFASTVPVDANGVPTVPA